MIGALVHLMNGDFPTTLFGNIMKRIFFVVSGKKYKPHKNMSHCREKRERERGINQHFLAKHIHLWLCCTCKILHSWWNEVDSGSGKSRSYRYIAFNPHQLKKIKIKCSPWYVYLGRPTLIYWHSTFFKTFITTLTTNMIQNMNHGCRMDEKIKISFLWYGFGAM